MDPRRLGHTGTQTVKIRYFAETDTLHIALREVPVVETRDLGGHTVLEFDAAGELAAITVEQASARVGLPAFSYEHHAA